MKIIIRGERGTGKSSLFTRLQGKPLPPTYVETPEIEVWGWNWLALKLSHRG
jgi:GTPase SAR1 family protein